MTWLDPFLLQWEDSFSLIRSLSVSNVVRGPSKQLVQTLDASLLDFPDFVFKAALEKVGNMHSFPHPTTTTRHIKLK